MSVDPQASSGREEAAPRGLPAPAGCRRRRSGGPRRLRERRQEGRSGGQTSADRPANPRPSPDSPPSPLSTPVQRERETSPFRLPFFCVASTTRTTLWWRKLGAFPPSGPLFENRATTPRHLAARSRSREPGHAHARQDESAGAARRRAQRRSGQQEDGFLRRQVPQRQDEVRWQIDLELSRERNALRGALRGQVPPEAESGDHRQHGALGAAEPDAMRWKVLSDGSRSDWL